MKQLDQKVGIITGAASGIGQQTAQLFAREGMKVVIADISVEKGEKVAAGIREAGGIADFIETNVAETEQVQHVIRETTKRHGVLNVLVNDAAHWQGDTTIANLDEKVWDKVLEVTLKGVYLCTKYAIPEMIRAGGGSIVNISSVNSVYPVGLTAYSAAKGGVDTLTKIVAVEYGKHKIRVNAILPGTTSTESSMAEWKQVPGRLEKITEMYPLGRIATPEDIANCALFLASDRSAFVNGVCILVDGGLTAGHDFGF